MKKPSFIIGKKHIILACLTLILGIAIYLNYSFAQTSNGLKTKPADAAVSTEVAENYGDAEFVNGEDGGDDYFAQARLDKITKRDEAVQTLQTMLGGGDLSTDELSAMKLDAVNVSKL
ncbi:MAG: SpoIIIAH-like family protein, partial [Oscillospiraceae bacterium]